MKLYKVTIDNNPGGWKSGEDPSFLVPANKEEDVIQKVKDGWIREFRWKTNDKAFIYKKGTEEFSPVRKNSHLSAMEIRFEDYDIHIKLPRKAKLDRIDKHLRNEQED